MESALRATVSGGSGDCPPGGRGRSSVKEEGKSPRKNQNTLLRAFFSHSAWAPVRGTEVPIRGGECGVA